MKLCKLFKVIDSKKKIVQCIACNHRCLISQGNQGICNVRKNIGLKLKLLTYGKPIAINIDPIEKKPLYHFLLNTKTFSIGTFGCNFKCSWCQNFDISNEWKKREIKIIEEIPVITPERIISEAKINRCESISYTYNEPTISAEFVKDCSKVAKKNKLKNIWVTNGYFTKECLEYFTKEKLIDAMNIDLKSFSEKTYQKHCNAKLEPILESIKNVFNSGIHLEITTLIIPKINDSKTQLENISKFIYSIDNKGEIPWHISRFFPLYKMKDRVSTPLRTLENAREIGKKAGLKFIYIGNI